MEFQLLLTFKTLLSFCLLILGAEALRMRAAARARCARVRRRLSSDMART